MNEAVSYSQRLAELNKIYTAIDGQTPKEQFRILETYKNTGSLNEQNFAKKLLLAKDLIHEADTYITAIENKGRKRIFGKKCGDRHKNGHPASFSACMSRFHNNATIKTIEEETQQRHIERALRKSQLNTLFITRHSQQPNASKREVGQIAFVHIRDNGHAKKRRLNNGR